jgi:hypothetical protein
MLTTVSIGVLSTMVIGARSMIFHSFSGGPDKAPWVDAVMMELGPATGCVAGLWLVNRMRVSTLIPSILDLALVMASDRSRRRTNPTRYCDSVETTTGNPL